MWYVNYDGEWIDSKRNVLFKETFHRAVYELEDTGIHFYGNVSKSTRSAIKDRIMRIFCDGLRAEYNRFNENLSYAKLLEILENRCQSSSLI